MSGLIFGASQLGKASNHLGDYTEIIVSTKRWWKTLMVVRHFRLIVVIMFWRCQLPDLLFHDVLADGAKAEERVRDA